MKKLAHGNGKVYVSLEMNEFTFLTGKVHGNVPDGSEISLNEAKQKLAFIDTKKPQLAQLKTDLTSAVQKLNQIGV